MGWRPRSMVMLVALFLLSGGPLVAGEDYPLVWDGPGTSDMGAKDIGSMVRGVNRLLDFGFDQVGDLHPAAGIPLRLGRFALIDGPLSLLAIWTQHEVFGHGARGREFGLEMSFRIAVPPPYGLDVYSNRSSWSEEAERELPFEKRVLLTTEGQESEVLLTRELVRQALKAGRWRRVLDTVLVVRVMGDLSRVATDSDWTYYQSMFAESGRDVFAPEWPVYVRWALDPLLWWALYDYFYLNLVLGEPPGPLPVIRIGEAGLVPRPSLRLAPWGEELGLSAFVLFPGALAEGEMLFGPLASGAPAFTFTGRVTFLDLMEKLDVGGRAGLWFQPGASGGLVEVDCTLRLSGGGSVYGAIGYKSEGYVAGRPYDAGMIAQGGFVVTF